MTASTLFGLAATSTGQDTSFANIVGGISTVLGGGLGFGLLLIPGWVVTRAYRRSHPMPWLSDREFAAASAFWGVIVQLLLLPWTIGLLESLARDGLSRHVVQSIIWLVAALYVVPTLVGLSVGLAAEAIPRTSNARMVAILKTLRLSSANTVADSWTWAWRRMRPTGAYVRVSLKDGKTTIVGVYGKESVAGIGATRDLYLQRVFRTTETGWFGTARRSERGIWIAGDQIASIEFYRGKEESERDD